MSGECAQLPHHNHNHIMHRLKKRVGEMQQHSNECQARLMTSQPVRVKAERNDTAKLMAKVQENKMRKGGKHKPESIRPKYDQTYEMRNDGSDVGYINLKRKMEMTNGLNHGSMFPSNSVYNGGDAVAPSSGVMQGFTSPRQNELTRDNGMEFAKKMKFDSAPQLASANGSTYGTTGSANSNNCNSGSITDLTSPQQMAGYLPNSNPGRDSARDSQSGPANPPSNLSLEQSQLLNASPITPAFDMIEQQSAPQTDRNEVGANLEEFIDNNDLESLLNELDNQQYNPAPTDPQPQYNPASTDPQVQANGQLQATTSAIPNTTSPNGGMATNPTSQLPLYQNSTGQQQGRMPELKTSNFPGIEQLSPPFNNLNQMKASPGGNNPQMNNVANSNITSHHLQNLSVSIDTNFGSPVGQHQVKSQQMQQQMPVNRIRTPSSVDKVRHTPDGTTHQSLGNAMTPSPGSYSMQFQPQNPVKSGPSPGANSNPYYGPISPRGQQTNNSNAMLSNNRPAQTNYGQPSLPQSNQTPYPSPNQHSITPGMQIVRGMSPSGMTAPSNGNQTQQMRQLGERRAMNVALQRSMTNEMTHRSAQIHQQQVLNMNNISASQNAIPNRALAGQQATMSGVPRGNINAANAAAQQVLAASQFQYDRAYVTRMPPYSVQNTPSNLADQRGMASKPMIHHCGNPECTQNHQAQMPMRSTQASLSINGLNHGMNPNPHGSSSVGPYSHLPPDMNPGSGPSSISRDFVQQQLELKKYKMKLAAQQRELYQRTSNQPNTSHPVGHSHVTSTSLPVGHPHASRGNMIVPMTASGMGGGEKAGTLVNVHDVGFSKMTLPPNGASWNGYYRSAQSGLGDPHHNHPYNVLSTQSHSFSPPSRNYSPMSKDMVNSVPMDRGSVVQGSNPMLNPVANRVTPGQMPRNAPIPSSHMRNMYTHSQGVSVPNAMLQGHNMVQSQMHHQGFGGQSVPANGVHHQYGI